MKPKSKISCLALCVTVAVSMTARAVVVTKSTTGTDLSNGASWGGTQPTAADAATWSGASLGAGLTLGSDASWGGMTITGAASNIDITGAGVLTLGTGGVNMEAANVNASIGNPINLDGAQPWKVAINRSLTSSGIISGTGGLIIGNPAISTSTFLTTTAQTLFIDANLSSFTTGGGWMGGAYVNVSSPIRAAGYHFLSPVAGTNTFWFKVAEGGFTKALKVELVQSGGNITARAIPNTAKYISGTNLAFDFETGGNLGTVATSQGAAGYGAHTTTLFQGVDTSGTVTLSGANTFSGGVTLNSGKLILGNTTDYLGGTAKAAGTGDVTVNPSGILANSTHFAIWGGTTNTRTVSVTDGTIDISLGTEYFHALNMKGGVLTRGAATHVLRTGNQTGGGVITTTGHITTASITSAVDMTNKSLTLNVADGTVANDLTISGIISENSGVTGQPVKGIAKTGAGTALLSGANTYTGTTTINGGTLKFGNKNALGAYLTGKPVTQVVVASGAAVDFNGVLDATYGYTISGNGVGGTGALTNSGGTIGTGTAQTSNIKLADDASIGGTGEWSLLTNSYGATTLDLNGKTLTKVGTNTFRLVNTTVPSPGGNIIVAGGTLATVNGASNASNAALSLNDTAGVSMSLASNLSVGSLSGGGLTGGNVNLGASTLTVGALGGDTTYAGVISGTGSLVKSGAGILTLTGSNSYTGTTTVNGGTLVISGTTATTGATVNTGATLNAAGTINGPLTVAAGGGLTPAGNGIGTLNAGISTLGGTVACQINKSGSILTNDLIDSTDALTYGGTLEITASGDTLVLGDNFKLFDAVSYSGSFTSTNLPALPANLFWDLSTLTANGTITVTDVAPIPLFNPQAGGYVGATNVTMTSGGGTTIHYTIDGSDPATSGTKITAASPATVTVPTDSGTYIINAYATRTNDGGGASATVSSTYSTITTPRWNVDENGDWSETAKWLNAVSPNAVGANVDFFTTDQTGDSTITLDGSRTVGSLTFGNNLAMNWLLAVTNNSVLTLATGTGAPGIAVNEREATINPVISGTQGLVKTGAGSLTLAAANTYTGGTNLRSGRLVGSANASFSNGPILLGETADPVSLYLASRADVPNDITVSAAGSGLVTIGGFDSAVLLNASSFFGTLTLNRATTFSGEVAGDRLAFDGKVTGNVGTLRVAGGSRVTFSATTNDFAGDVVVSGAGTVLQASVATAAEVIPNGSNVTVGAGAFLQLASTGGAETINALNGAGTVRTFPSGGFGTNLTVGSADGSGNFNGALINGTNALSLTKTGTGTQVLSGPNTYTGNTVVNAGTLELAAGGRLTFSITNSATNTLTGAGTVTINGDFAIDTSAVTTGTGPWQIENITTLTGAYGPTFKVVNTDGSPWTDAGSDKWTKPATEGKVWVFNESTGALTLEIAGYDSWLAEFTFPEGADTTRTGDPDGDGFSNLQEFLFGSSPIAGNGALATTTSAPGGVLVIRWSQRTSGTSYQLKESSTLANDWANATGATIETDGAAAGNYQPMKATVTPGAGSKFFRVEGIEN